MIELHQWISSASFPERPWLLLGKGPSFSRRDEFPLGDYNLLGLNNVVGELPLDVAHMIDIDVVDAVADRLEENCRWLVMPRRPHVDFEPSDRLLEDFVAEKPVLRRLEEEGRLVWYNAASPRWPPVGDSRPVQVRNFSSEAALEILGRMGVRRVRSLGIDGGQTYGREFADLKQLLNGRPSFDAQFREIEDTVRRHDMDYDPLVEPMRIYVGLDESQIVAARVLEHSIRKHASRPVRVIPMLDVPTPEPKDPKNRGRTGFSFARFHIPKLAGYKGRAMYVDADMQVFSDIAEVFDIDMQGAHVLCTRQDEPPAAWKDSTWFKPGRQMSVMLLDCEKLDWDIDRIVGDLDGGRYTYEQLMFDMTIVPEEHMGDHLPPEWNHLETYEPGKTKLLHYTVVPTQPWKNDKNPLRDVWMKDFEEAREAGIVTQEEIQLLVRKGHIKPALASKRSAKLLVPYYRALSFAQRLLQAAEARIPFLRHPRVMRLRSRVGRAVGA